MDNKYGFIGLPQGHENAKERKRKNHRVTEGAENERGRKRTTEATETQRRLRIVGAHGVSPQEKSNRGTEGAVSAKEEE